MNASSKNNRILVIDDNPAIHEDFKKILCGGVSGGDELRDAADELFGETTAVAERLIFEIDSAFQGREGLDKVRQAAKEGRDYALAFVDVRMPPGWDGVETISRIWKEHPDLQVVICTAYSDHSWEEIIRQVGRTESLLILKKPFDNVEVLQLAHALTEKWALSHHVNNRLHDLDRLVNERTHDLLIANANLQKEAIERERTQAELRRSEERFSKAFRASPVPITIQTLKDEHYVDVNDSFLVMTGYRRDEVIGKPPAALNLCEPGASFDTLSALLAERKPVRRFESRLTTKSGEVRDVVVSAEVFDLGGEPCVLTIAEDVSDRLALEQQLRQSQKLEAVGQLAAGVAHDFNNLLTVIQGHASLRLAAKNLDCGVTESLSQVGMAAERAAALTRQLLAFGRKQTTQVRVLDLNYVIERLAKMLGRLIGAHIKTRWELLEGLPYILADEGNVEQILVNLALNACDAMPDGGTITFRTSVSEIDAAYLARRPEARAGKFVRLTVSDTGHGMDAATMGKIFEPFFTTKDVGKGTGLGLSTVHGIVTQHEGWIEVASTPGAGSTFEVLLPANEGKIDSHETEWIAEEGLGGSETVLVVEDEPAVREIVRVALEEHGYRVLAACDGPEALRVWAAHSGEISLLLTDVVMPSGITGCELARRLRAERQNLKVVVTSGYSGDIVDKDLLLKEGMIFVSKPYKAAGIIQAIRRCLDTAAAAAA